MLALFSRIMHGYNVFSSLDSRPSVIEIYYCSEKKKHDKSVIWF